LYLRRGSTALQPALCDPSPVSGMTEHETGWCSASAGVKIIDSYFSSAAPAVIEIVHKILILMINIEFGGV
jgi:hypothetical protein